MSIYDITVKDAQGRDVSLGDYRGKVLLIVNTATHCGFTPQYEGLQAMYDRFRDRGFEVLDFPCNQFAHQAPESDAEIGAFCMGRFGTTFTHFQKIEVNGDRESPLYTLLKREQPGTLFPAIKWNFTKFLVDRQGRVVARYAPMKKPQDIESEIEKIL